MPESGNIQETKSHKRMNDTELRKKQILKAATDLFMENGYQGVNIDVIAEKCGIVRGTVLRYFGSKRELYNQVLLTRGNLASDYLGQICEDESISVNEALDKLADILIKQFTDTLTYIGDDIRDPEYRQNFDVLRLPIFRETAKSLEKLLLRGNQEGVLHIDNPKIRAYSTTFAIFGIGEASETPDNMYAERKALITALLLL